MAKSMLDWHSRHRFCANCGAPHAWWRMRASGATAPPARTQHFPRTDPVVIMLVTRGDKCLLGRQSRFQPRDLFVPRRLSGAGRDHRGRGASRDLRGGRHTGRRGPLYCVAAVAVSVLVDDRLRRRGGDRRHRRSTRRNSRTFAGSPRTISGRCSGTHANSPRPPHRDCAPPLARMDENLEHFRAKWLPVRVKKMRSNKKIEPCSDGIRTGL